MKIALLIACFFFSSANGYALDDECIPELNTSGKFETRLFMPEDTNVRALVNNPRKIKVEVDHIALNGRKVGYTITDFDAVYPVEMKKIRHVILDYDNYGRTIPRITYAEDLCGHNLNPDVYHKVEQVISTAPAGSQDYDVISNDFPVLNLGEGQYGVKWNLEEELDKSLYEFTGSWYLAEFKLDGKVHTYVRNYVKNGYSILPASPTILRMMLPNEIRQVINSVYKYAARL